MKQIKLIVFFIFLSFFAYSKTVTKSGINDFAKTFLKQNSYTDFSISSIDAFVIDGKTSSYIVRLTPVGFMIISADEKVEPLLAYSMESDFQEPENWPDHINWWMYNTNKKVLEKASDKNATRNSAWEQNQILKSAKSITVAPLLKVKWDQGRRWNQFCPKDEDGPGGNVYVGCVGVSMAQAMSKYSFPTKGIGKSSYVHKEYGTQTVNFETEDPYQWDSMAMTSANIYNARLLYHCAVTVNMDFGPDGSGAQTKSASGALKTYFDYSKTTRSVDRVDNDDEWKQMLIDNLAEGCPIIYSGDGDNGEAGHAWNIDGVDASGLFHVNWGWSGSMNGYFNINNLAPGSYDFTHNQSAILGLKPKAAGPIDLTVNNLTVKEKQPAGTFVGLVFVDDEYPENPYSYNLKGAMNVILGGYTAAKFYIENDSLKTLDTFDYEKKQKYTLFIEAVDTLGHSLEKMFEINIISTVGVPEISTTNDFKMYPNPFNNTLNIKTDYECTISIFNQIGQKVEAKEFESGVHILTTDQLKSGMYLVEIKNKKGTFYNKMIKK